MKAAHHSLCIILPVRSLNRNQLNDDNTQVAVDAFALTPFRKATVFSLVLAAFSSLSHRARVLRPCDQRSIPAYLIMFDCLGVRDDGGVKYGLILNFRDRLVGLLDNAVNSRTLCPAGLLAELLEDS